MEDIELVIKIPKGWYQKIKETNMFVSGKRSGKRIDYLLFNAVHTGIPLPKRHGRLIDVDTLEFRNVTVSYGYDWECGETTYVEEAVVREDDIWNAPTIIEADTESEE